MINVKYPRRGFVVEEVIQGCCCETAEKFVVIPWEDYGEDNFNNMTEDVTIGEYGSDGSADDYTEGECPECEESVVYKHYFVVTSDANAIKTAEEAVDYAVGVLNASFPEGESLIATDAESSYSYADCVLKAPFPLGEPAIATNAQYSYEYSRDVLHAPFPLGEDAIGKDAHIFKMYKELFPEPQATPDYAKAVKSSENSYLYEKALCDSYYALGYAEMVLKAPFPEGEKIIATSPSNSYFYAKDVLRGRFLQGEAAIATDADYSYHYALEVLKEPFPLGEKAIAKNAKYSYYYAVNVLKAPFPEGEAAIATSVECSYGYAKDVLHAPFPLGETAIATAGSYSYGYAKDVLHAPFPLGEKAIATNGYYIEIYKELFPETQVAPAQAPIIEEPQAPDSINIVSGFYLKEKTSMSDKQKRKQKIKDVIKNTFLTLVYTLEEIIDYDQEGGTYHFVGSLFQADNILKSIHDLMETFPNLTEDLALQEYDEVKSYMDEYSKYRKEKQEKEKPNV